MVSLFFSPEIGSLYLSATNGYRVPETVIKIKRKPASGLKHIIGRNSMSLTSLRQEGTLIFECCLKQIRLTIATHGQPETFYKSRDPNLQLVICSTCGRHVALCLALHILRGALHLWLIGATPVIPILHNLVSRIASA